MDKGILRIAGESTAEAFSLGPGGLMLLIAGVTMGATGAALVPLFKRRTAR